MLLPLPMFLLRAILRLRLGVLDDDDAAAATAGLKAADAADSNAAAA